MAKDLIRRTEGKVRTLTLNRPDHDNTLSNNLTLRLGNELMAAEHDSRVAVVILTGSDPAFCAGLDDRQVGSETYDYSILVDPQRSPWKILNAMDTPVIAAVNGAALTGGLALALMSSFVVASERATFGEGHAQILDALPAAGPAPLLAQVIGVRRARELSFTAYPMGVAEAYERNLVNHVVSHCQLSSFTMEIAQRIAANDPETVGMLNRLYRPRTSTCYRPVVECKVLGSHRSPAPQQPHR